MIVLKECVLDGRHQQFNPKTRPSKQCEFCNYLLDKSLITQAFQSGSIGQDGPGGPFGPFGGNNVIYQQD